MTYLLTSILLKLRESHLDTNERLNRENKRVRGNIAKDKVKQIMGADDNEWIELPNFKVYVLTMGN